MENNKKSILLSVVGVVMLLIAAVGVSFAFFSYTKVSTNINSLSTGTVSFDFTTTKYLQLDNKLPESDASGMAATGDNNQVEFNIVSTMTSTTKKLEYKVYAVPTEITDSGFETKTLFDRDQIKLHIKGTVIDSLTDITFTGNGDYANDTTGDLMSAGYDTTTGRTLLGTGYVTGTGSMSFVVHMWISSDVTYGTTGSDYPGVLADGSDNIANKYYAMKIRVESHDVTV